MNKPQNRTKPISSGLPWWVGTLSLLVLLIVAASHGHRTGAAIFCAAIFIYGALHDVCRAIERGSQR